jgi:hypothetical protein
MILNEGLNRVRDLVDAGLDKGQCGDDDTLPTATDTGLGSAIATTLLTLTSTTKTDKMITTNHNISSVTANGETFKEHEIRFANGDSFNHVVHASVSKSSSVEVEYITNFMFEAAQ